MTLIPIQEGRLIMAQPPLPPPEHFERKEVTGHLTDRISIGRREDEDGFHVAVVLTGPDNLTLVFQTSPAGARQLAASVLNQADEVEELYR
jgi:hypothetical protein